MNLTTIIILISHEQSWTKFDGTRGISKNDRKENETRAWITIFLTGDQDMMPPRHEQFARAETTRISGINIRGKKTRMEYVFSRAVDDFLIELSAEARPW